jgi:hypothetical protein
MMRKLIVLLALAAVAVPAALADTGNSPNASQQCVAQRTSMGTSAFTQLYGTTASHSNAFGRCVSKIASADAQNTANASAACKAEQKADAAAFQAKYANGNGHTPFGRCVSQKAQAAAAAQQQATINAARACRAEQKAGPAAFAAKYGTSANKHKDAFGKCVSAKTHA